MSQATTKYPFWTAATISSLVKDMRQKHTHSGIRICRSTNRWCVQFKVEMCTVLKFVPIPTHTHIDLLPIPYPKPATLDPYPYPKPASQFSQSRICVEKSTDGHCHHFCFNTFYQVNLAQPVHHQFRPPLAPDKNLEGRVAQVVMDRTPFM